MKLILQAVGNNWEKFKQRKRNAVFMKVRTKILDRDGYICQFCHFESSSLEVINMDNNYSNNSENNLITACSLCAKCTLLDSYGIDYAGKDKIIYCPELSQEQMNQLSRLLMCHMFSSDSDEIYNAKMTMAQLQDRAAWLDEKAGCKLSHPALFVHYMNAPKSDKSLVGKLRWLPDPSEYEQEIQHWRSQLFAD